MDTDPDLRRFGSVSALLVAALTTLTFAIAILTPPLSGPFCPADCYSYPYADIASRFPRDYYWMIPAILLMVAFVALMVSIGGRARGGARPFAQTGLCIAAIAAAVLIVNYWVQLSVIQPSVLAGESDGVAMLTQYNAHGLFIALEEVGYLLMSLSLLLVAPVFARAERLERLIRWTLAAVFPVALAALAAYSALYGVGREYRFEVMVISINFVVLIVAGLLLARWFRRGG